jgi:energy-coupling factor transport system ATP-binding protein
MPALDVSGLTYTYPGSSVPALKNVSFQAESGQLLAIVGPNEAGKSTLSLALAGLIPALFHGEMLGRVAVCGLDTRDHSPGDFSGRVGLVLQNPVNQLSGMRYTVYDEVAFGLENLGIPRIEMPGRIEQALVQVGLVDLRHRSPYTLSGGQQQRLALASVLVMSPSILILDEPTAMLDPQGRQEIFGVVQSLAQTGVTVIVVEHHLEWIARHANRVLALENGEVILDGPPDQVLTSAQLRQNGVGWLRYTRVAALGQSRSLWPANRGLPVTLKETVAGFRSNGQE